MPGYGTLARVMQHRRAEGDRGRPVRLALGAVVAVLAAASGALVGTAAHPRTPVDDGVLSAAGSDAAAVDAAAVGAAEPLPQPEVAFTIGAAGDVLTNLPVNGSARTDGGYDFSPLLAPVDPWVRGADLALCHLEVPLVPTGVRPSGYPVFGAPVELARDLAEQGWDGCSTASNHSVDLSSAGVTATLDALDAAGLGHVGTARSEAESLVPELYRLERGGRTVTVAHLAATYGTNGLPIPADAPWSVTLLDADDLVARASAARAGGADLVVVSVHAGVEYTSEPDALQREVAARLAASGAVDLVVGHHAHVPQPVVRLPGGPEGTGMWVAYGLGNLVSNQDGDCCDPRTDSGLLLTATVRAPATGPAQVTGVEWTPITVDRRADHRVRALVDALADPASGSLTPDALRQRLDRVRAAVGTDAPERLDPAVPTGPAPQVVRPAAPPLVPAA